MTPEELMRPRYKVIADYPGMSFKIGDTLTYCKTGRDSGWYNESGQSYETCVDFPHLFKKLEWWEERPENELPNFIRYGDKDKRHMIYKVRSWDLNNEEQNIHGAWADTMDEYFLPLSIAHNVHPVTEQEYNEHQKSKTP